MVHAQICHLCRCNVGYQKRHRAQCWAQRGPRSPCNTSIYQITAAAKSSAITGSLAVRCKPKGELTTVSQPHQAHMKITKICSQDVKHRPVNAMAYAQVHPSPFLPLRIHSTETGKTGRDRAHRRPTPPSKSWATDREGGGEQGAGRAGSL